MQPFVAKPASGFQLSVPLPAKGGHRHGVRGNGAGDLVDACRAAGARLFKPEK
jgi:hypothetical protein